MVNGRPFDYEEELNCGMVASTSHVEEGGAQLLCLLQSCTKRVISDQGSAGWLYTLLYTERRLCHIPE